MYFASSCHYASLPLLYPFFLLLSPLPSSYLFLTIPGNIQSLVSVPKTTVKFWC